MGSKLYNKTGYALLVKTSNGGLYFVSPRSYRTIGEDEGQLFLGDNHFSMRYGYSPVVFENGKIWIDNDGLDHSIVNYTYKLVQELKAKDPEYQGQT
jgi:hypothetical protein